MREITEYIIKFRYGLEVECKKELVRCEYCKHRPTPPKAFGAEINGKWCYWCEHLKSWEPDDWFCADGERES